MKSTSQLQEHEAFMKWFGSYYPNLSNRYGKDISPAIDDSGLVINWKHMGKETASMLARIIYDYNFLNKQLL